MTTPEIAPNVHAQAERQALSDLFLEVGPDAPTLCEGWNTRDLAGHLIVREGANPLPSFGIFLSPLKGYLERKQRAAGEGAWPAVVDRIRTGPPKGSFMRKPKLDGQINTIEYFVHLEDVRRGAPGWEPRVLSTELSEDLWARIPQFGKRLARKSPVGIVAKHSDGRTVTVKDGPTPVTLTGDPGEVILMLFGRDENRVKVEGDPAAVTQMNAALTGI
jgi:uncharacterized protein (TIGR03085 family)